MKFFTCEYIIIMRQDCAEEWLYVTLSHALTCMFELFFGVQEQ